MGIRTLLRVFTSHLYRVAYIRVFSPKKMVMSKFAAADMMRICVSDQTIIGSDNGLTPGRRQVII